MREYGDDWRQAGHERPEPQGGQRPWPSASNEDRWAGDDGYPPPRTQPPRDTRNPQGSAPAAYPTRATPRREPPRDPRNPSQNRPTSPQRITAAPQSRSWQQSTLLGPLILIVVPLLGAVASGPALGVFFTVAAVAAALGAALLSTENGLWWIVPCTPTALLAVAFAWVAVAGVSSAKTSVAAATNVFDGLAGAFPGIAAGTVAALVVAGVRVARNAANTRGTRV
ncbi:DUF6542 domain-containing protein [Actinocrinis sp.]|uniref:DUF6542 domain-containing protein n=1 Tax=Actinocrinis sp. TaxID=1920516 RepID=UPI002DDC953E|nr:DUF6542 domain-containing protein [Actinocrinis sp.]